MWLFNCQLITIVTTGESPHNWPGATEVQVGVAGA